MVIHRGMRLFVLALLTVAAIQGTSAEFIPVDELTTLDFDKTTMVGCEDYRPPSNVTCEYQGILDWSSRTLNWTCNYRPNMPGTAQVRCTEFKVHNWFNLLVDPDSCRLVCLPDRRPILEIEYLELFRNRTANKRRLDRVVPQLSCTGYLDHCPGVVNCTNPKNSTRFYDWECDGELSENYTIYSYFLSCEGYDYIMDPFIYWGSCSVICDIESSLNPPFIYYIIMATIVITVMTGGFFLGVYLHRRRVRRSLQPNPGTSLSESYGTTLGSPPLIVVPVAPGVDSVPGASVVHSTPGSTVLITTYPHVSSTRLP